MKKILAVISTVACSIMIAMPAFSAPNVSLVMDSKKVEITKEGKEVLSVAKDAKPGDTLLYTVNVVNKGDAAAYEVEAESNIPPGTIYIPEKNTSNLYKVQFSIDKGATYQDIPKIRVQEKGKTVEKDAPIEMYRKIKWIVKKVDPNKNLLLSYKVKVRK